MITGKSSHRRRPGARLIWPLLALLVILGGALVLGGVAIKPRLAVAVDQLLRLRAWFADPAANPDWTVLAGVRCQPDAPMLMPTAGYIGFGWDDSFRPGHRHTGRAARPTLPASTCTFPLSSQRPVAATRMRPTSPTRMILVPFWG